MALKVPEYETTQLSRGFDTPGTPRPVNRFEGLARGGQQLAQSVERYQMREAELRAEEELQSFVRASNELLLTGDNPYYGSQGKDSVDRAKSTIQQLEELKREHLGRVRDPVAARMLDRSLTARVSGEMERIQKRALDGQKEWDLSLAQTGAEQAAENIQLYINDPVRVRASKVALRDQVAAMMEGMPVEAIDEKANNLYSKALAAGIDVEMERSVGRAKGMFERYKDEMEVGDRAAVEKKLKATNDRQMVAAAVNDIRASSPGNLQQQIETARKYFKGDVALQDDLKRRLTADYKLDEAAQDENNRKVYEHLANGVMLHGTRFDDLPLQLLDSLSPAQISNLKKLDADAAEGKKYKTDWAVWTKLMGLPEEDLVGLNPIDYRSVLSDTEYKSFVSAWDKARQGNKSEITYLQTLNQELKSALEDLPEDEHPGAYDFLQSQINLFRQNEKRNPKRDEISTMISDYFMPRRLSNFATFHIGKTEEASIAQLDMDNVDPKFADAVRAVFKKDGREATDADILRLYRNKKMKEIRQQRKVQQANDIIRSDLTKTADE